MGCGSESRITIRSARANNKQQRGYERKRQHNETPTRTLGEHSFRRILRAMANREYHPATIASRSFAEEFYVLFDAYIELRAQGTPPDLAVIDAFELIQNGLSTDNAHLLGMACEVNPYVKEGIKRVLAAADLKNDLWPERKAVHRLLSVVEDPREKAQTRINAINSLNVLCGYVVLDEVTGKRVDKTISEFKKMHASWIEAGSPPRASATQH